MGTTEGDGCRGPESNVSFWNRRGLGEVRLLSSKTCEVDLGGPFLYPLGPLLSVAKGGRATVGGVSGTSGPGTVDGRRSSSTTVFSSH